MIERFMLTGGGNIRPRFVAARYLASVYRWR